jgi:hypothetical protein
LKADAQKLEDLSSSLTTLHLEASPILASGDDRSAAVIHQIRLAAVALREHLPFARSAAEDGAARAQATRDYVRGRYAPAKRYGCLRGAGDGLQPHSGYRRVVLASARDSAGKELLVQYPRVLALTGQSFVGDLFMPTHLVSTNTPPYTLVIEYVREDVMSVSIVVACIALLGSIANAYINNSQKATLDNDIESLKQSHAKEIEGVRSTNATQLEHQRQIFSKELENVRNVNTAQMEHVRADLAERRDALNASMSALSGGFAASHSRTLTAIENLWNNVLEIRRVSSGLLSPYAVLLPEEYASVPYDKIDGMMPKMSEDDFNTRVMKPTETFEVDRPFIGENLWRLFFIYRAFAMREMLKVIGWRKDRRLLPWDQAHNGTLDVGLIALLKDVFGEEEFAAITAIETVDGRMLGIQRDWRGLSVPNRIMGELESRILTEANRMIFGKVLSDTTLAERIRISDQILRSPQE